MDTAICILNGRTYTAVEFAALGEPDISRLRHSLQCTACRGNGYFKKAARSGQGPCFGARPHAEDCDLAVKAADPWGEIGDDEVRRLEADETRIILSLGRAPGSPDAAGQSAPPAERPSGRRFVNGDPAAQSRMQRNPEKLLRMLVGAPSFRTSGLLITTGSEEVPASQFFVEMATASRTVHADQFRAYWGVPRYTNVWNGVRIFNGGPRGSLGFELTDGLIAELLQRYGLDNIEEIRYRYVMFIGRSRITTGDSFMMDVSDIRHVAILPASIAAPEVRPVSPSLSSV